MIVVAFALFLVLILAWLAAPDGREASKPTSYGREIPAPIISEPAV